MTRPLLALAALFALSLAAPALALPAEVVAKRGLGASITVRAELESGAREGSGFFIERDVFVTLASTVAGASRVSVRLAGQKEWLEVGPVIARDPKNDLILLRLESKQRLRPLSLSKKAAAIGQTVYAVAAPPKTQGTFHKGLVNGIVEKGGRDLVQTDAALPAGAEGGVLLAESGQVVGVLVRTGEEDGAFRYAVAVDALRALKEAPPEVDPMAGVDVGAASSFDKGILAERKRRWAEAEKHFADALSRDKEMSRAQKHLGRAIAAQNRHEEAAEVLSAYRADNPDDLDALFELAEVQRKRERTRETLELFTLYATKEQRESRAPYVKHANRWRREITERFERRLVLLPLEGSAGSLPSARVGTVLKERIGAKTKLDLLESSELAAAVLEGEAPDCREKPACIWRPAWARWIVTGALAEPPEGKAVALDLSLFDVRAKKRIATASVASTGQDLLPLDIDDALPTLFAELPPELAGSLAPREGGGGRRPLLLDDAPPDEAGFEESEESTGGSGGLAASSSASGPEPANAAAATTPAPSTKSRRGSLRDDDARSKETRRVAKAEAAASGGFRVMPWLLITGGVAVAGGGLAYDLLSPTSANYNIGVLDFVGPGIMAVGAATVITGFVLNPFGGEE